jgi:F-type H+-transporting ATPase subunit b
VKISQIFKIVSPALALALVLGFAAPRANAMMQEPAASTAQIGDRSTPEANSPAKEKQEEDENEGYRHSAMVTSLGAKLGMNPEQAATTFTLINLVVLIALVGWFLLKSLPKTFRDRNAALEKHLVEAKKASDEAKTRLSGVEGRLAKLDEQIASMRAQAEKDAQAEELRMRSSVEEEKQKILASAEQEIASAATQARRQIQQYAADLAIDQAAKKLVVSAETDRLLVQEFARRLGGDNEGGRN